MSEEKNILKTKSIDFALSCIRISKGLMDSQKEFILSKQFLKSGTSIGANIHEAQNAESKADFIHKLAIAQKECGETIYWITLLQRSCYIDLTSSNQLNKEALEIMKIIRSIILTLKQNNSKFHK